VYAVLAANPNVVVVVRCPGACFMPWINDVPAVLYQLMPGQESGNALASAIFGATNPSGKLPVSFPLTMDDTWLGSPVSPYQYPGVDLGQGFPTAQYLEGMQFGYMWYLSHPDLVPLFPFGHGLSYTSFTYSSLSVAGTVAHDGSASATVSFVVSNSGSVAGAEVAQMYLEYPQAAGQPSRLLRGFEKVFLGPGESSTVSLPVTADAISIFDLVSDSYVTLPGSYAVFVGSSSVDIRLVGVNVTCV
jgi:beta-glucosidase